MKTAILGTTGYTGMILLRLLANHPEVEEILPVSSSKAGTPLVELDPGLSDEGLNKTEGTERRLLSLEETVKRKPDVVFAALPHLASAKVCGPFFGGSVVVDLSADFRIRDAEVFTRAYGAPPPKPELLPKSVYGLCEWYEEEIRKADIIANPGCYPTATLLPLLPLVQAQLLTGPIIVNALSGISGAGKKAKENLLFCERTENTGAYSPGKTHRHTSEIQQEIDVPRGSAAGEKHTIFFTPHLVPLKRGMAVTSAVELKKDVPREEIFALFKTCYDNRPFVKVYESGIPQSRSVWGSNRCDIGFHCEEGRLFLFSAIDNLVKGASGQAVQNMNIRFGFEETAGLTVSGEL